MAFAKTIGNNGYDVYTELSASGTTSVYTGNISMFCGKKITGTLTNVSAVTSITTTANVQVSMDGTTWATLPAPTITLVTATNTATQGFYCDLSTVYAPYVRIKITINGTTAFTTSIAFNKNGN